MPPTPQFSIATPQYRSNNPFNPVNTSNNPSFGEHRSPTNTATNYSNMPQTIYTPQNSAPSHYTYPNSNLSAYNPPDAQHQQLPQYAVPTLVINDVEDHNNNVKQTQVQQHDGPASDTLLASSPRRSPPSSPRRYSHGAATHPRPNFISSAPDQVVGPPPLPPKDGLGHPPLPSKDGLGPPPVPPKSAPSSPSVSPRRNNNNIAPQQDDAASFPIHDKHSSIDPLDLVFPEMAIETEMLREKLHVSRDLKTEEAKPSDVQYAPPMSPRTAEYVYSTH